MERPRLSQHVALRFHTIDSVRKLVLVHSLTGMSCRAPTDVLPLLNCADGTRDLAGIVAAATLGGHEVDPAIAGSLFAELQAIGMLEDGPESAPYPPPAKRSEPGRKEPPNPKPPHRTVVPLPMYRFECDGVGTCCQSYPTIGFSNDEVVRALSLPLAQHEGGFAGQFGPSRGGNTVYWRGHSCGFVDGKCTYLAEDGLCDIHRRGGADAKPFGCQQFPAVWVDDGEELRTSVLPECACAFRSARRRAQTTEESVAPRPDGRLDVRQLPLRIALNGTRHGSLATYRTWAKRIGDAGLAALEAHVDAVRALWAIADAIDADAALDGRALAPRFVRAVTEPPPLPEEPFERAKAAAHHVAATMKQHHRWRAQTDRVRRTIDAMEAVLSAPSPEVTTERAADEQFYVRALHHAHAWLDGGMPPLSATLRIHALRIWMARRTPVIDPAADPPLGLIEAVCRAHPCYDPQTGRRGL